MSGEALKGQPSVWDRVKNFNSNQFNFTNPVGLAYYAYLKATDQPTSEFGGWAKPSWEGDAVETPTETSLAEAIEDDATKRARNQVPAPGNAISDPWATQGGIEGMAIDAGQGAQQQYLDEMTDQWRLKEEGVEAQYGGAIDRQSDRIADLQGRLGGSMDAYGRFEDRMGGIDTAIPYGAIAELDTSRVTRQFDEAEGRLGEALNLARDDFSNQMVNEIRYFEDVTETMLGDDINNIEMLHELGAVYAQALADEAYTGTGLEAERAKLELRAQFDRSIYDAQREMQRLQQEQTDALRRANADFQQDYPDFNANREAITETAYFDWTKSKGMSAEDSQQAWDSYKAIYGDPENQNRIATQADFDRIQRQTINYGTVQYLDEQIWGKLEYLNAVDLFADPMVVPSEEQILSQEGAIRLFDWMDKNDIGRLFNVGTQQDQTKFMHMLIGAGINLEDSQAFIGKAMDASAVDSLLTYDSDESRAARQAYRMTNNVDDNWENIYYQSMTIPVDSQYIYMDPTSKAVFPVAGPEVAFDQVGNVPTSRGTPVVSTKPGKVIESKYSGEDGYYIIIQHDDGSRAKYAHLETEPLLPPNGRVSASTSIGRVGNTGSASTDPYALYFTYWDKTGRSIDPSSLFSGYGATP